MEQMYQYWWMIYRKINVFPTFEYHMFYILYLFVKTYLLTLSRITRKIKTKQTLSMKYSSVWVECISYYGRK
jgi:hypothetical protein